MNLLEALNTVQFDCPSEYARSYAGYALKMDVTDEGFRTQLLYVRSNLSSWRGPLARQARAAIDEALKS